jgi:hypothetical protein
MIRRLYPPTLVLGAVLVVTVPAAAASTWTVVSSADPSPTFSSLAAVTALSPTDAWAVGTYQGSNRHDGKVMLAERWNGSVWSQVPTPNVSFFDEKLLSVSAASASDAWAVGSTNQTSFATTNPIAAHWDGSSWTIVSTPATTGSAKSILAGVTDFGSSNAWAVGKSRDGTALIEHWTGTAWSIVPAGTPQPPAGETLAGSTLTGISALSPSNIWAVGSFGTTKGTVSNSYTLTEHYDGVRWTVLASPNPAPRSSLNGAQQVLKAVTAVSASNAWAVGNTIDTASGSFLPDKTLVLHYNGTAWSVVASPDHPGEEDELLGLAAKSATDVWAVGDFVDRSGSIPVAKTLTLHWSGSAWSTVTSPNGATSDTILTGAAAVPGTTSQVWAAGFNLSTSDAYRTFVLRTGS